MNKLIVASKRKNAPYIPFTYFKFPIDRSSPLGNPFILDDLNDDLQRSICVSKYEPYLQNEIHNGNPEILAELDKIEAQLKKTNVALMCWCSPKQCHGDIIKKIIENRMDKNNDISNQYTR